MNGAKRINTEKSTLYTILKLYCSNHHQSDEELCPQCRSLYDYAMERIDACVFGNGKPTCQNCPVHCYKKDRKEEIRQVMRYIGPRMPYRHPLLTIRHFANKYIDKKKIPQLMEAISALQLHSLLRSSLVASAGE